MRTAQDGACSWADPGLSQHSIEIDLQSIADLLDRCSGVDPKKPIWMFVRSVKISSLDTLMKGFGFRFKAIGRVRFAAHGPAILGHRQRNIDQPGPIGVPPLLSPGFEDRNPVG